MGNEPQISIGHGQSTIIQTNARPINNKEASYYRGIIERASIANY